ncbi:unnamed protein product, partial [Ectocarpus sp. 12 AP-2014]
GAVVQQRDCLLIRGDWVLAHYRRLKADIDRLQDQTSGQIHHGDLSGLGRIDTAGAALLAELLGAKALVRLSDNTPGLPRETCALLHAVAAAMADRSAPHRPTIHPLIAALNITGQRTEQLYQLLTLL